MRLPVHFLAVVSDAVQSAPVRIVIYRGNGRKGTVAGIHCTGDFLYVRNRFLFIVGLFSVPLFRLKMEKADRDIIIMRLENWGRWAKPSHTTGTSPLYSLMKQYGEQEEATTAQGEPMPDINARDAEQLDRELVAICNDFELAAVKLTYIKNLPYFVVAERLRAYRWQIPIILDNVIRKLDNNKKFHIINIEQNE